MTTFTPSINPSVGITKQVTPRILTAGFGDGYSQRAGDGLNVIQATMEVVWELLTEAQMQEIVEFFEDQRGYLAFDYTPPGDAAATKWIATKWGITYLDGDNYKLDASFKQVFDL